MLVNTLTLESLEGALADARNPTTIKRAASVKCTLLEGYPGSLIKPAVLSKKHPA
jgi:hypothetical protein